jgi:hypothetical protein
VRAVASFVYSVATAATMEDKHAFYMPMARFWEIAVGGCVAAVERHRGLLRQGPIAAAVAGLGLLAIVASVLLLDSDSGGQQWVAIAVLGAAAVICGSAQGRGLAGAVLASRPMVAVGRISFSVYLVHWPLIVFWQMWTLHALLPYERAVLAVLTLALAALLYAFVETPMRAGSPQMGNRPALTAIGAATAAVAVAGTAVALDGGAAWRLREPARQASDLLHTAIAARPRCVRDAQWQSSDFQVCRWNSPGHRAEFVIWGDSHARAVWATQAGRVVSPCSGALARPCMASRGSASATRTGAQTSSTRHSTSSPASGRGSWSLSAGGQGSPRMCGRPEIGAGAPILWTCAAARGSSWRMRSRTPSSACVRRERAWSWSVRSRRSTTTCPRFWSGRCTGSAAFRPPGAPTSICGRSR